MADRTIGELDPVKEVPISELPQVLDVYDDSLIPLEQQGMAMRMTGRQFRQFGEKTAEIYVNTAVEAAADAEAAKTEAEAARDGAAKSAANAAASETAAGESKDAAALSAQAAKDSEEKAKASEDSVAASAAAAQASAESAAGSVRVIEENAEALQTVQDNLEGILAAPDAADRAEAAADAAEFDAERAEEAANRAQSIAQGAKGYYETPESLRGSVPEGTAGDWAIVGSTDTIWVWDSDSGDWKDSHQATDLSNYYTKDQADEENNKLLAQITQETDGKLAEKLGKTETAVAADYLDGFGGKAAAQTWGNQDGEFITALYCNGGMISFRNTNNEHINQIIDGYYYQNEGRYRVLDETSTAAAAQKLAAPQTINGVAFDGTAPITVYDATKQPKHKTLSLSLAAASWDAANAITVAAAGVTASNTLIIAPAPASFEAWSEAGVRCTAQAAGSLTFTALDKPTVALTAQVLIFD